LASGVGGYLFDNWTYTGPFLFMGLVNAAVLFFAIYVKLAYPSKAETDNERLAL
jgi:hypothetical protein